MAYHNTRAWRCDLYKETKRLAPSHTVSVSEKINYNPDYTFERKYESTPIIITDEDTLIAGKRLKDAGRNPMMLNFANDRHPGGGVESGAGAQEESLFRRTNLNLTLLQPMYPIKDHQGIYTPVATVFRDSEDNRCAIFATPWQGSFATVPGIYHPNITSDGRLDARDASRLAKKIRVILQMGAQKGHDVLVLGALGCGAWGNPPAHVAEIFRDVLVDYDGVYKEIVFAILDRGGSANYAEFVHVFRS